MPRSMKDLLDERARLNKELEVGYPTTYRKGQINNLLKANANEMAALVEKRTDLDPSDHSKQGGNMRTFLAGIAAAVVIVLLAWYFWPKGGDPITVGNNPPAATASPTIYAVGDEYSNNGLTGVITAVSNDGTRVTGVDWNDEPETQASPEPDALASEAPDNATDPNDEPIDGQTATTVKTANDALNYPDLVEPDPSRQQVFPDVPFGDRPALVGYESPFEDADFCDNTPCNMDVPQFYHRVMTAGQITIPELGVDCVATDNKGCLVIVINHFGETAMFRDNVIDHGFTVAGRVWDMSKPRLVTLAGQALLDHYVGRMLPFEDGFNEGANCGTIDGCQAVEWHVVVIGNASLQKHWMGVYTR